MPAEGRTAVFTGPRSVRIESRVVPEPGANQVRVRLEGCGVCGSNLPVWQGRPWFEYPREPGSPGHEGWGIVDAIGAAVTTVSPGDRVAALSYHAFGDYDLAEAAQIVALPKIVEDQPFPGEALGCAMNVFARSEIRAGDTVAIVGIGFMGALLTQLASRAGARVIAMSRRDYALKIARQMGANYALSMSDRGALLEIVKDLTNGRGCERVIEATGFQEALDLATELTAERGRLIIAGYHQDGLRQVNMQLWNWRGLDVINAHEREMHVYVEGMRAAARAITDGQLDPSSLYTSVFSLEQIEEAFRGLEERDGSFLKALLVYDR